MLLSRRWRGCSTVAWCRAPVHVPFWSGLPRAVRWRAAREVPSVVVAVSVVSSFCVLCLVYLSFVCSRPCSCCRSERRVNNSVCSCHGCYTHIGRCGLIEK